MLRGTSIVVPLRRSNCKPDIGSDILEDHERPSPMEEAMKDPQWK